MLYACSEYCARWLAKNNTLSEDDREIYIYGFELLFSTMASLTSILLISVCMKRLSYAICFLMFFFVLRLFCGGYHAQTFKNCFYITNLSFFTIIGISELIIITNLKWIIPIVNLFTVTVVWILAPVKNENHPCSERTSRKNKIISRIISLIYGVLLIFILIFTDSINVSVNGSMSFFWVSLMILTEKFRSKGGENIEHN